MTPFFRVVRAVRGRNVRGLPGVVVPFVAAVALLAQSPEQTPVFHSAIEAVQFDVYVSDAAGNPATGLTIDDFEVLEDGKPQPVTTFEAVNVPIERAQSPGRTLAEPDVAGLISETLDREGMTCQVTADLARLLSRAGDPVDAPKIKNLLLRRHADESGERPELPELGTDLRLGTDADGFRRHE